MGSSDLLFIIVFLVVLGILVVLMQKSGGAKAYGDWAGKKIKSKGGALAATALAMLVNLTLLRR